MPFSIYLVFVLLLSTAWGCAQQQSFSVAEVETQARTFMESYAEDLRNKAGDAVASRYNRSGSYRLGHGKKQFNPFDTIRASYLERFPERGPSSFEWHDLSYEVLSADAVLVVGRSTWGRGDSRDPLHFSYTGLLTRQDGELRIRLEDESRECICPDESTSQ